MPKALAVVAHHDDHIPWVGGALQRLVAARWECTVIAMCVPAADRRRYFDECCSAPKVSGVSMGFADYQGGAAFSRNNRGAMEGQLLKAVGGERYDYVFTHRRHPAGEYGGHANHDECRALAEGLMEACVFGWGRLRLAHFSYAAVYGSGNPHAASASRTVPCKTRRAGRGRRHDSEMTQPRTASATGVVVTQGHGASSAVPRHGGSGGSRRPTPTCCGRPNAGVWGVVMFPLGTRTPTYERWHIPSRPNHLSISC